MKFFNPIPFCFRRQSRLLKCFNLYFARNHGNLRKLKSVGEMPGPRSFPFIGTSWVVSPLGQYTPDQFITTGREDFFKKYGPVYKEIMGGHTIVNVHHPSDIENVMRRQGKLPLRVVNEANVQWRRSRPDMYHNIGLVDALGEEWQQMRRKASPVLKQSIVAPFVDGYSEIAEDFVALIKYEGSRNPYNIGDLRPYLYRFALEGIWKTTMGHRLGTLRASISDEAEKLIRHSQIVLNSISILSRSRPWWKILPTPTFKKFCASEEALFRIISRYVQILIEEKLCGKESDRDASLLSTYISDQSFHVKDINTLMVDYITAGISTTSYSLSLLLHRLGKEPYVQKKIQEEIDSVIKDKDMVVNDRVVRSLPYLKAVMQEGYRLTNIIPAILKIIPENLVCGGYEIPAFTPILCQTWVSSRSENYFSRSKEFLPERWLKSTPEDEGMRALQGEAKANQFTVLPFGFGPRMCIGKTVVQKEVAVLLSKIFSNFSIESKGDLLLGNDFLICPRTQVNISFKERH